MIKNIKKMIKMLYVFKIVTENNNKFQIKNLVFTVSKHQVKQEELLQTPP